MDFHFKLAQEKLQREQQERKEKAKQKLAREKAAREEALRRQQAIEAEQRIRRLEVAKKREQEEEDLLAGDGIRFNVMLQAIPYEGFGDKIKLPPSSFDALESQNALDRGPMFFEVSSAIDPDNFRTYSGVLEFTASEGTVELPPAAYRKLFPGSPDNPRVRVKYVRLSKGKYAKLQPESIGFLDLPNHKAVLETTLRQYATLSEGDLLIVRHGHAEYRLRVLELSPDPAISVLETDIEVDVVEPSGASGTSSDMTLFPLVPGKPESGTVQEGQFRYYKFSIDSSVCNIDLDVVVKLVLDNSKRDGDADLYIARHPILFPTRYNHHWSSHDLGSKIVSFRREGDTSVESATYSIGVFGFRGTAEYTISVEWQRFTETSSSGQTVGAFAGRSTDADSVQCQNCKMYIPSRTVYLHEAYCLRNNVACKYEGCGAVLKKDELDKHVHCAKCGKVFQQPELDKHVKVFHEPLNCQCGAVLEKEQMVSHQASECPLRIITCRFCGDMVQAGGSAINVKDRMRGLSQHESDCGCRTSPCDVCGRAIVLKDMDLHLAAVHWQADHIPKPEISNSSNNNFSGSIDHAASSALSAAISDRAMLVSCPMCGISMHSERDVSHHIDMEH